MSETFRVGSIVHLKQHRSPLTVGPDGNEKAYGILLNRFPIGLSQKWHVYWFDFKMPGTIFEDEIELVVP